MKSKQNPDTSIIIATKNRPTQLLSMLQSILIAIDSNTEIIIVDQSDTQETSHIISSFSHKNIHYISLPGKNKSIALNKGIQISHGELLLFTDDDCIVTQQWLKNIRASVKNNPNISAFFGKTLAYEPAKHKNMICPSIFNKKSTSIITKPTPHYKYIGFGNNMTIRRSLISAIGPFKTWLGPGSLGSNAEDGEIALRALILGHKVMYDPEIIVYHNKWLTKKEMESQELIYLCGEIACYGYFSLQGYQFASSIIRDAFQNIMNNLKTRILSQHTSISFYFECKKLFAYIRGLAVARYFSIHDKIIFNLSSHD